MRERWLMPREDAVDYEGRRGDAGPAVASQGADENEAVVEPLLGEGRRG